ncbi:MAG: hypothetical protein L0271_09530 [Gemmatimonadetes bacterium]|nr:hypothetical protein [Gemmatimonadota bacterium]
MSYSTPRYGWSLLAALLSGVTVATWAALHWLSPREIEALTLALAAIVVFGLVVRR